MKNCSTDKKIIYDIGSNNGDDIPYYLKKADLVVAIEANPDLCEIMKSRYADDISMGRLIVESCVITDGSVSGDVLFYRHKTKHVLSQFPQPVKTNKFDAIKLTSKSIVEIITNYGPPFFVKIDVEHYDQQILRALFNNGIRPPFISAESHSIVVFALLVAAGNYNSFKLVDGPSVSEIYRNAKISSNDGSIQSHTFPHHSAGPFGDDISGNWLSADQMFQELRKSGLGWKDLHATNVYEPNQPKENLSPNQAVKAFGALRKFLSYLKILNP